MSPQDAARPPWIAGVARLPAALLAPGLLIHLGVAVGALLPGTLAAACALAGLALGAPLAGAAAETVGERAVLLLAALVHVPVLLLILPATDRLAAAHAAAGVDVAEQPAGLLLLVGALALLAGASCPAVPTLTRMRRGAPIAAASSSSEQAGDHTGDHPGDQSGDRAESWTEAGLRREARRDEGALILAPLLLGVLAPMIGSSAGLLAGALVAALVVPLQAMDPRAAAPSRDDDADGGPGPRTDATADPPRLPLPGLVQAQQHCRRSDPADQVPAGEAARDEAARDEAPAGDGTARLSQALVWALGLGGVLGGLWAGLLAGPGVAGPRPGAAWGLAVAALAAVLASRRPPRRIARLGPVHRRRPAAALLVLGVGWLILIQVAAPALASAAPRLLAVVHGPAELLAAAAIGAAAGLLTVELHRMLDAVLAVRLLAGAMTLVPAAVLAGMSGGLLAGGLLGDLLDATAPAWVPPAAVAAVAAAAPSAVLAVVASLRR